MENSSRSQDIYEQISVYPKPPKVPLPDLDDPQAYLTLAGTLTPTSLRLSRFLVKAIGLKKAYPGFSEKIEQIQRTTNLRLPGLYSPVISATINLADDPRELDPYDRAATLIRGARSLCDDLFSGLLPPDTLKGQALEMGQYPNLFATSLAIENGQVVMYKSSTFDTITVMLKGRIYQLQTGHVGVDTSLGQVAEGLRKLVETPQSSDDENTPGLGILTCANDHTQIQAFSQMHTDSESHQSLIKLRHSFLTVCLELDHHPETFAEAARLAQVGNPNNRWQHASLQLVIFGNGRACIICNFTCYLDGNVMMRGAAEIQRRAAAAQITPQAQPGNPPLLVPTRLVLKVDPQFLSQADKDFQAVLDQQQATFEIADFGRKHFAAAGVSAVQVFILGLALTGRKLTGVTPRVNQFLSMSRYRCMDMFSAIVTTPEVEACVEYLLGETINPVQAQAQIRQAVAAQEQAARQARNQLSLLAITNLYLLSMKKGFRRRFSVILFSMMMLFFKRRGYFRPIRRDVLVSFPEIYPEIPLVGRPGVRLPYVRQYSLHYQIFEEKTVITFMPGLEWKFSNQELIDGITNSLIQLKQLVGQ